METKRIGLLESYISKIDLLSESIDSDIIFMEEFSINEEGMMSTIMEKIKEYIKKVIEFFKSLRGKISGIIVKIKERLNQKKFDKIKKKYDALEKKMQSSSNESVEFLDEAQGTLWDQLLDDINKKIYSVVQEYRVQRLNLDKLGLCTKPDFNIYNQMIFSIEKALRGTPDKDLFYNKIVDGDEEIKCYSSVGSPELVKKFDKFNNGVDMSSTRYASKEGLSKVNYTNIFDNSDFDTIIFKLTTSHSKNKSLIAEIQKASDQDLEHMGILSRILIKISDKYKDLSKLFDNVKENADTESLKNYIKYVKTVIGNDKFLISFTTKILSSQIFIYNNIINIVETWLNQNVDSEYQ